MRTRTCSRALHTHSCYTHLHTEAKPSGAAAIARRQPGKLQARPYFVLSCCFSTRRKEMSEQTRHATPNLLISIHILWLLISSLLHSLPSLSLFPPPPLSPSAPSPFPAPAPLPGRSSLLVSLSLSFNFFLTPSRSPFLRFFPFSLADSHHLSPSLSFSLLFSLIFFSRLFLLPPRLSFSLSHLSFNPFLTAFHVEGRIRGIF